MNLSNPNRIAAALMLLAGYGGLQAAPPEIAYPPQSRDAVLYQRVAIGVITRGTQPMVYRWFKDGALIPGSTNHQVVFLQTQLGDEGNYWVTVSNAEGSVTSAPARLTVKLPRAGDLDGSFLVTELIDGQVRAVAVQSDGNVVVGGEFSRIAGARRHNVARLTRDGTLDSTFGDGLPGVLGTVDSIVVQPDGRIVIGGRFTEVNGTTRTNTARLNPDGSLDPQFLNGLEGVGEAPTWGSAVYALALQPDGKILVGGDFRTVNGVPRTNLARLNSDGSLDESFESVAFRLQQASVPGSTYSLNPTVYALALAEDGTVLVGGRFLEKVLRLNPDGSLAEAGNFTAAFAEGAVRCIAAPAGGPAFAGGNYDAYRANFRAVVVSLNSGNSFARLANVNSFVQSVVVQQDGKVLVGGLFHNDIALFRFNPDGSWDKDIREDALGMSVITYAMQVQSDGKILVGGYVSGSPHGLARLHPDGTLDRTFTGADAIRSECISPG